MSTSSKPITYPGMQCVMQYLSPKTRLNLIQKAPATRAAHRSAQMKLDHLEIGPTDLQINDMKIRVGVITHFPNSKTPGNVREVNKLGGASQDLGKFGGFKVSEPSLREHNEHYEREQKLMELLKDTTPKTEKIELEIERLQLKIREFNEKLAFARLKKEHYLQLTVGKNIERVTYAIPIKQAMQYVIQNVLGYKNQKIFVQNHLKMSPGFNWLGANKIHYEDFELVFQDGQLKAFEISDLKFDEGLLQDANFTPGLNNVLKFKVGENQLEEVMKVAVSKMTEIEAKEIMKEVKTKDFPIEFSFVLFGGPKMSVIVNEFLTHKEEKLYEVSIYCSGHKKVKKEALRREGRQQQRRQKRVEERLERVDALKRRRNELDEMPALNLDLYAMDVYFYN